MKGLFELLIYRGGAAVGILLFTVMLPFFYEQGVVASSFLAILYLYLLSMFSKYGTDMLLLKDIPNESESERKAHFSSATLFVISCSLCLGIVFFIIDSVYIQSGVAKEVAVLLMPFSCLMVFSSYLRAINKRFLSAVTENGNTFLITSLSIPAMYKSKISPLLILAVVGWASFMIFLFFFIKKNHLSILSISKAQLAYIKVYGRPFAVLAVMSYIVIWYPALLLEKNSLTAFVDYNLALRFVAPFTFVITTVDFFASTKVTNYIYVGDNKGAKALFYKLRTFFCIVGLVYVISTIFITYSLSNLEEYKGEFFIYYCALIISYYLTSILGPTGIFLNMYGQISKVNKLTFFAGVISAIIFTLFISYYNAVYLVYLVCCMIFIKGLAQLSILKKEFGKDGI